MYSKVTVTLEQLRRGLLYFTSLKDRKLTSVNIYATSRCNGRCETCHIWKIKNKEDINLDAINNILKNENPGTQYFLSGGEFLLHPKCEEILRLFKNKNYVLLSNGLLLKKLIETVKKYKVKRVVLSFDGLGKTYKKVRGIDNFNNLHELIHKLNKICAVSLNYTISPLNDSIKEINEADRFAKDHHVYLALGVYETPEFFHTSLPKTKIPPNLPPRPFPLNKYLALHNKWLSGKVKIPCLGIRNSCTILPNGDISMCYAKNIIVGNVNKNNLEEVWKSEKVHTEQEKYFPCTKCWLICQKPMDIVAWEIIKKMPRGIFNKKFRGQVESFLNS